MNWRQLRMSVDMSLKVSALATFFLYVSSTKQQNVLIKSGITVCKH
jgi:hypothetical protein